MKYKDIRKYTYNGHSMYPFLQSGDVLYFGKIPFHAIRKGDIVVFFSRKQARNLVSRVIRKSPIVTKGDNFRFYNKEIVEKGAFLGKVYTIERGQRLYNINAIHSFIMALLSGYNLTPGIIRSFFLTKVLKRIKKKKPI